MENEKEEGRGGGERGEGEEEEMEEMEEKTEEMYKSCILVWVDEQCPVSNLNPVTSWGAQFKCVCNL